MSDRTEPVIDIKPEATAGHHPHMPRAEPLRRSEVMPVEIMPAEVMPVGVMPVGVAAAAGAPRPRVEISPAPAPHTAGEGIRLVMKRTVKSGLMGGKKFEVWAKVEADYDLVATFKGYPDELVLAYRSIFVERSVSLKRSEILRGTRLPCGSLNEMIEFEDQLELGFEQLKRMVDIVRNTESDRVVT